MGTTSERLSPFPPSFKQQFRNANERSLRTRRPSRISPKEVVDLAAKSGIAVPPAHEAAWADVLSGLNESAQAVLAMGDYLPSVDLDRYPRTDVHVPADTVRGGWALKVKKRDLSVEE